MSRLAKKPLPFPAGVTCTLDGSTVVIQGPKGKLSYTLHPSVSATVEGNSLLLKSTATERKDFAQWGLAWAIIRQKMAGVTTEYKRTLQIIGVGYRVEIAGKKITLSVGFSHKVFFEIPEGVTVTPDPQDANTITISGIDAQQVGEFAASIRSTKTPEPYKGKGIRYTDEYVRRKAGKTAAK
jgi:large subunit ribosomal protein L6